MKKSIWAVIILCIFLCVAGCGVSSSLTADTAAGSEAEEEKTAILSKESEAETITQQQNAGQQIRKEESSELLPHEYQPATDEISAEKMSEEPADAGSADGFSEEEVPETLAEGTEDTNTASSENLETTEVAKEISGDPEDLSASELSSENNEDGPKSGEYKHPEYQNGAAVGLDLSWEFADYSVINSGAAVMYRAEENRKNIIIGVNAGHGTAGGESEYVYCHPDYTPKVTGGTNAAGSVQAMAISSGMTFFDGTAERDVNEAVAQILKELLLQSGYDVLMIRDGEDVQLDNIARTVICNNVADCHIAIHYDGDGFDYDKGCYYMAVADGIKEMYPVSEIWWEDDRLGDCLIAGLSQAGAPVFESGSMQMDLTQTSFSSVPSVDIELGNAASGHSDEELYIRAAGLLAGIELFFES